MRTRRGPPGTRISDGAALLDVRFGSHGGRALVPWFWAATALNLISLGLLMRHGRTKRPLPLSLACAAAFVGIWVEKSMGLIVPGFVPGALHELSEHVPSIVEWKVAIGIWDFGLPVLIMALKLALPILQGRLCHPSVTPA